LIIKGLGRAKKSFVRNGEIVAVFLVFFRCLFVSL